MIDYRFQGRLQYIPGGALNVQMSAWPAAGANWWEPTTGSYTVVAAYQAKGAASLAASYVNLANPGTYDLTEGVAPTFDTSTGWTFAGSEYLDTGLIPTDACTVIARFSDAASGVYTMCGNEGGGPTHRLMPNRFNNVYYNTSTKAPGMTNGVLAIAADIGYRDGVEDKIMTPISRPNYSYYLGAQNQLGTAAVKWYGKMQAFAFYSTTLDATQVAEITDNMEAL